MEVSTEIPENARLDTPSVHDGLASGISAPTQSALIFPFLNYQFFPYFTFIPLLLLDTVSMKWLCILN